MDRNASSQTPRPAAEVLSRLAASGRRLALLVFILLAVAALLAVREQRVHEAQIAQRVLEANRLKMLSAREHIEEYLRTAYSTLYYVSLDPAVQALDRERSAHIASVYRYQQRINHLTELYAVGLGFDGRHPPELVFSEPDAAHGSEAEEYRAIVEQLARYAAVPNVEAQLSREVALCLPDSAAGPERGVVLSVPLRRNRQLVGEVAGMISTRRMAEVLARGNYHNMVVLVSEGGSLYGCVDLPDETREWFAERFRKGGVSGFFAQVPAVFSTGNWISQWIPVTLPSEERWWLVWQHQLKPPPWTYQVESWAGPGALLLVGVAVAALLLVAQRRSVEHATYAAELEQAARQISESLRQRELLLKETNHRVKNNLQLIASLLNLELKQIRDPGARSTILDCVSRVTSMAQIHERLYRSADLARVDASAHLRDLVTELLQTYQAQPGRIVLQMELEEVYLEATTAIHCGLIVNELVSNALKHAFPGEGQGTVTVSLRRTEPGQVELAVSDDGAGLPAAFDLRVAKSLGMQLVRLLAQDQLRGSVQLGQDSGTQVRVTFPAPA